MVLEAPLGVALGAACGAEDYDVVFPAPVLTGDIHHKLTVFCHPAGGPDEDAVDVAASLINDLEVGTDGGLRTEAAVLSEVVTSTLVVQLMFGVK